MEAICYLSANKNTYEMEKRLFRLPENHSFNRFVLTDKKDSLTYDTRINHHVFNFSDYITGQTILRYTFISLLDFFVKNPNYKNYWLIEDDLIFKGDFELFFEYYKDNTHDFLLPGYHFDFTSKKRWYRSVYNKIFGLYYTDIPIAGGFVAIARFSNRLLLKLVNLFEKGICGHCESFPHTVCMYEGFDIYSLNNDKFHDFEYCDQDKRFKSSDLINVPDNKLIHAVKF